MQAQIKQLMKINYNNNNINTMYSVCVVLYCSVLMIIIKNY